MSAVVATPPRTAGFVAGTRAMLPLAIGCAPFGVAVGATIADSNVDVAPTLAAALLMFGGSAQLAVVQMLDAGAAPLVILTAAVMINLRFVAYSAALAPLFPTSGRANRAAMAATLVDQTYLVTSIEATNNERAERELERFYVGASVTIGVIWVGAQVVGVLAGSLLPEGANLGAAAPISLAGLAAGVVSARASRLALASAVAAVVVLSSAAGQLALVMAIVLGVGIAACATPSKANTGRSRDRVGRRGGRRGVHVPAASVRVGRGRRWAAAQVDRAARQAGGAGSARGVGRVVVVAQRSHRRRGHRQWCRVRCGPALPDAVRGAARRVPDAVVRATGARLTPR